MLIILYTLFDGDFIIPRRKQKIKYTRKLACKYLAPKGDISNSLQPLCVCPERDLIIAPRAYVCQVCYLYDPKTNLKISDVYEESKKTAEKKIKEELAEFELKEIESEDELDLSIDEFEEEEEEVPLKFEKRKARKDGLDEGIALELECPFCGDVFDDLASHIQQCEFAPDDASIEDIMPKKKKKRKAAKAKPKKAAPGNKDDGSEAEDKEKKKCPYCEKEFLRLGRHLNSCPKKPSDAE